MSLQWNCDDFEATGERLVGEFERDVTGDKRDERLDATLEGDEHSNCSSSWLLFDALSLSHSLMMIMLLFGGGEVISTSSSELPSDDLMLLLSSLDTSNVNLFLLNRFFRFRQGRVSGNGGWLQGFGWCWWWTRKDWQLDCVGWLTGAGRSIPSATRLCSNSNNWPMKFRFGDMIGRASFTSWYASSSDNDL